MASQTSFSASSSVTIEFEDEGLTISPLSSNNNNDSLEQFSAASRAISAEIGLDGNVLFELMQHRVNLHAVLEECDFLEQRIIDLTNDNKETEQRIQQLAQDTLEKSQEIQAYKRAYSEARDQWLNNILETEKATWKEMILQGQIQREARRTSSVELNVSITCNIIADLNEELELLKGQLSMVESDIDLAKQKEIDLSKLFTETTQNFAIIKENLERMKANTEATFSGLFWSAGSAVVGGLLTGGIGIIPGFVGMGVSTTIGIPLCYSEQAEKDRLKEFYKEDFQKL